MLFRSLAKGDYACAAPLLMARKFLLEEGFTDIQYYPTEGKYSVISDNVLAGRTDLSLNFTAPLAVNVDRGDPLVMIGGANAACFEMYAAEPIRSLTDLRGKRIALYERDPQPLDFAFVTSILQYIGLQVGRDVEVFAFPRSTGHSIEAPFRSGVVDAVFANFPFSLTLRDTRAGNLILNSMTDRPWSEYVCCQVFTSRPFLEKNPVATRRALRAILRGVDICAREPERAAQALVDHGWVNFYQYALESTKMISYAAWRTYNSEDTIRFYSLGLGEAGVIKSTPDEIIKRGTDFRFLNELKKELAFLPAPGPKRAGLFGCDIDGGIVGPQS